MRHRWGEEAKAAALVSLQASADTHPARWGFPVGAGEEEPLSANLVRQVTHCQARRRQPVCVEAVEQALEQAE